MKPRHFARRVKHRLRPPGASTVQRLMAEGIVSVGKGTYGIEHVSIPEHRMPDGEWVGSRLIVGKYCSLNAVEFMLGGNHNTSYVSLYPFASMLNEPGREQDGRSKGDIVIGNDVWIAAGALVLSGVTIGDGAVIAARAVVTKDVSAYAIVGGNPGRVIGHRFDEDTRYRVHSMRWWDWTDDELRARWRELSAPPAF
jgi:chloramphenicol O-acetyltransferase type B